MERGKFHREEGWQNTLDVESKKLVLRNNAEPVLGIILQVLNISISLGNVIPESPN